MKKNETQIIERFFKAKTEMPKIIDILLQAT